MIWKGLGAPLSTRPPVSPLALSKDMSSFEAAIHANVSQDDIENRLSLPLQDVVVSGYEVLFFCLCTPSCIAPSVFLHFLLLITHPSHENHLGWAGEACRDSRLKCALKCGRGRR